MIQSIWDIIVIVIGVCFILLAASSAYRAKFCECCNRLYDFLVRYKWFRKILKFLDFLCRWIFDQIYPCSVLVAAIGGFALLMYADKNEESSPYWIVVACCIGYHIYRSVKLEAESKESKEDKERRKRIDLEESKKEALEEIKNRKLSAKEKKVMGTYDCGFNTKRSIYRKEYLSSGRVRPYKESIPRGSLWSGREDWQLDTWEVVGNEVYEDGGRNIYKIETNGDLTHIARYGGRFDDREEFPKDDQSTLRKIIIKKSDVIGVYEAIKHDFEYQKIVFLEDGGFELSIEGVKELSNGQWKISNQKIHVKYSGSVTVIYEQELSGNLSASEIVSDGDNEVVMTSLTYKRLE